jgi:hypothetical protein
MRLLLKRRLIDAHATPIVLVTETFFRYTPFALGRTRLVTASTKRLEVLFERFDGERRAADRALDDAALSVRYCICPLSRS